MSTTLAGVPLPSGWAQQAADIFGTGPGTTIGSFAELHAKYYEGMYYNRDAAGLVNIPNVVVNNEQETYSHFEDVIVFETDHLTIQARGQPDGSITSGEMVSLWASRSFCVEARYQVSNVTCAWPAFWHYCESANNDASEIDTEQPICATNFVTSVSLNNHPQASDANTAIASPDFTTNYMFYNNPSVDLSAAPHTYTTIYDDEAETISRYIDGALIYTVSNWKWNATLAASGYGDPASTIVNLAVGGDWTGNVADPASFSADFDVYSLTYYGPGAAPVTPTPPVTPSPTPTPPTPAPTPTAAVLALQLAALETTITDALTVLAQARTAVEALA